MKISEMRDLTPEEIQKKIGEARQELMQSRFKNALHQLENTATLKQLKLQIAQLSTVLREKQLASEKQGSPAHA